MSEKRAGLARNEYPIYSNAAIAAGCKQRTVVVCKTSGNWPICNSIIILNLIIDENNWEKVETCKDDDDDDDDEWCWYSWW